VHAVAMQQRARMVMRGVPNGRIGIGAAPGEEGGAIDDEIARR
jgi:hypothetical protein